MNNKGNDGSGNIIDRDNWETPQKLFDKLNKQYNFNIDCCAIKENSKCNVFYDDFLKIYIGYDHSTYWLNPPFSKSKEIFERFFYLVKKGVAIYRCDNLETKLWQNIILKNADWIFIPNKRIKYEGYKGKGSRFPSALIGIGLNPIKNIEGITLEVKS